MNKIYYLQQEVKLNDEIDFKGLKIKLTQEIIDNNPNLFTVKEIIEFPEYVECVSNYMKGDKLIVGEIYKKHFDIYYNCLNDVNFWFSDINLFNKHFKPSTKEQFEKQNKIESIIEEAKIKFPIGSRIKIKGNDKVYTIDKRMILNNLVYHYNNDKFIYIQCKSNNNPSLYACPIYNLNTNEWLAEPIEKEFEDYKQELLNEVPYNYLYNNNPKLFYFELLNRICKDINKDWVYDNKLDKYYSIYYMKDEYTTYDAYLTSDMCFKLATQQLAEKLIELTPNSVLDLLFKS